MSTAEWNQRELHDLACKLAEELDAKLTTDEILLLARVFESASPTTDGVETDDSFGSFEAGTVDEGEPAAASYLKIYRCPIKPKPSPGPAGPDQPDVPDEPDWPGEPDGPEPPRPAGIYWQRT